MAQPPPFIGPPSVPPARPAYLSPDGRWYWDGISWLPWVQARPYRPAAVLGRWTAGLLGLWLVTAALVIVAELRRLTLVNRLLAGDLPTSAEADASDAFVQQANLARLVVYAAVAIVFLVWLHRIVSNGPALGARWLRFTPGMAVGWWFVPFANLIRPEQVIEEAWRVSDPSIDPTPDARRSLRAPMVVRAWWATWVVGLVAAVVAGSMSTRTAATLQQATTTILVAEAVRLVAAVLAIAVVLSLTERQGRKAATVLTSPAPAPPPGEFLPPPPLAR
jgi:hypothetical protein